MSERESIPHSENQDSGSKPRTKTENEIRNYTRHHCTLLKDFTKESIRDEFFAPTLLSEGTPLRAWFDSLPDHLSQEDENIYNELTATSGRPGTVDAKKAAQIKQLYDKLAACKITEALPTVLESMVRSQSKLAFDSRNQAAEDESRPFAETFKENKPQSRDHDGQIIEAIKNGNITALAVAIEHYSKGFGNWLSESDRNYRKIWITRMENPGYSGHDIRSSMTAPEGADPGKINFYIPRLHQIWSSKKEATYQEAVIIYLWLDDLAGALRHHGSGLEPHEMQNMSWDKIIANGGENISPD